MLSNNDMNEIKKSEPLLSKLVREQLKLEQIKSLFNDLQVLDFTQSEDKEHQNDYFKMGLYYGLIGFGLLEQCAGSFVFGFSIVSLLPGLPKFSILLLSAIYTILDSILFYAFEITFLKEALGIKSVESELKQLVLLYKQQLCLAKQINIHVNALKNTDACSKDHLYLLNIINQDLIDKYQQMQNKKISIYRQILKYGVLTFGVCANIAESYFFAHTFLLLLSSSLPFSGLGYLIIAITITANLGFFYAMGASSVIKIIHPELSAFEEIKKELQFFSEKIEAPHTTPLLTA